MLGREATGVFMSVADEVDDVFRAKKDEMLVYYDHRLRMKQRNSPDRFVNIFHPRDGERVLYCLCVVFVSPGKTHFSCPGLFYHIAMAQLIAKHGIVLQFPWLRFTTLAQYFTDQHLSITSFSSRS